VRVLLAVLTTVALACAGPAGAQKHDLSRLTCREFLSGGKESIALIVMWLQGYGTDTDEPTIVDFGQLKIDTERLSDYCAKHPDRALIVAAKAVMDL
jgi:acid stress chaperone HdeB